MSQENVEIVKRVIHAFNNRDFDAMPEATEDFVLRQIGGFADMTGTEFRGSGVLKWIEDWIATIGGEAEIETILEADDKVVVILRVAGTGAASGAQATMRPGQVFSFRDRKISAVDSYYDAGEALKAVGLSEQDAHADS